MTIRIYMANGHHASGVDMTLREFEQAHREAEATPGSFLHATDGRGFVHAIRPAFVSHAIEDRD